MKDFNRLYIILLLFFVSFSVKAQQDPNFSMYKYNMNVINPAYAGTNGNLEALVSVRSQWSGVQDAPETYALNINSPVGKNVGVGLNVVNDQVFVLDETHLYADFSYKIKLTEQLDLHAGIKAGGSFLNIDLNKVGIEGDPLFAENVSRFNPNAGLGFYLKGERFYITLSAPNLLSNDRFEKEGVNPVSASDDQQFYLGGGYIITLNDNFKLQPSALGRAVSGVPLSIDITTSAWYKDRLELGVNYRLDESITTFLTTNFMNDTLSFGYAYEYTTTDIGTFNNGTHEIILKLSFR